MAGRDQMGGGEAEMGLGRLYLCESVSRSLGHKTYGSMFSSPICLQNVKLYYGHCHLSRSEGSNIDNFDLTVIHVCDFSSLTHVIEMSWASRCRG